MKYVYSMMYFNVAQSAAHRCQRFNEVKKATDMAGTSQSYIPTTSKHWALTADTVLDRQTTQH